ncbi:hypothetical protein AMTR_s00056p00189530 [Amborella trichopoda]|uniref:Uncharacterized protein n=1 Tax=Amborella trichopoda TaxID=13333 RepID=U5D4E4_AMBTC|nr:hypothetical protein AMTR_s00056p00189530 [Amborella trichopoda]
MSLTSSIMGYIDSSNNEQQIMLKPVKIEPMPYSKRAPDHTLLVGVGERHGRGQLIALPCNEFNHTDLKKNAADTIPLEHVTRIFPIIS